MTGVNGNPGQKSQTQDTVQTRVANAKWVMSDTGANISALDYTTNLVSRYAFGGNGNDSVGTNNLTANGSPTYIGGVYGQAALLNGTTQYFDGGNVLNIGTGDQTITGYFKLNATGVFTTLVSKRNSPTATTNKGYYIGIKPSNDRIYAQLCDGSGIAIEAIGTTTLSAGIWYFFAVTWARASNMIVYLNAVQEASSSISAQAGSANDAAANFRVGLTTGTSDYLNGVVDQIQVFNSALSLAQIQQIYNDCQAGTHVNCILSGSGFNQGITYRRSAENTAWEQLIDNLSAQTITGAKTFSNANINLSNNTITDTSTAAGDLAKSNGTSFLRFAKGGTAFQVLRVNSGVSDIEYANCRFTELGRTQLGADGTSISVASLPTVKRLIVLAEIKVGAGSSTVGSIRFNNDSGTNYSYRYSENGAAEVTGTSQTSISFHSGSLSASETANVVMHISNDSTNRKLSYISVARDNNFGAGTAPVRLEEAATWDNTASQINRIDFLGTNNFLSGSRVTVYGAD